MAKNDLYDISSYTEDELYEILDLVNPSDRELEAKILMMIHKYENTNTKSGKRLSGFFENVYERFFHDDESEETAAVVGGDENGSDRIEGFENITAATEEDVVSNGEDQELVNTDIPTNNDNVLYTTELAYSKGKLNPILKQTTKRIVSIDSQYRSDK